MDILSGAQLPGLMVGQVFASQNGVPPPFLVMEFIEGDIPAAVLP